MSPWHSFVRCAGKYMLVQLDLENGEPPMFTAGNTVLEPCFPPPPFTLLGWKKQVYHILGIPWHMISSTSCRASTTGRISSREIEQHATKATS